MIASPNHSARGSAPVRLVVVHTAEGSRRKEDLGRYFQGNVGASSHVGIDAAGIEPYVSYDRSAWTLLNGNPISDNAELCAFAEMTREQWFSEVTITFYSQALRRNVTVDNPKRLLDNTAAWIRERCLARSIPIRKLTPAQVDAGWAGVIGHADWSVSIVGQGDHTDPGKNFPWDYVIARAAGVATEEDDMGWDDTLTSYTGFKATAAEWLTMANAKADEARASAARTEAGMAALAASVSEGDLDSDAVLSRIDTAVREATKAAVTENVLPALRAVVGDVLGGDNAALAEEIVTRMGKRMLPSDTQE